MAAAVLIVGSAVLYRYSRREQKSSLFVSSETVVSEPEVDFPIILNCLQCGSRVRVAKPGSFRCPSCKSVSDVDEIGKIQLADVPDNAPEKPSRSSSLSSRLRMESFFSDDNLDEESEAESPIEEPPVGEPKLSASELSLIHI